MPGEFPRRIEPVFHDKVWGSPRIEPWFAPRADHQTGEVWFAAGHLLIKFLFTSENLSIQVHPGDDYAARHENSRGKSEMWHILRAEPGAKIAAGFRAPLTQDRLREAASTGAIMDLLNWIEVAPGETYFIPAGTVHAIGSGVVLCEIQQNSDVTYRLYDYGRPRELHLEKAVQVAILDRYPGKTSPCNLGNGVELLVDSPFFRTLRADVTQPGTVHGRYVIVIEGAGRLNGLPARAGQVWEQREDCPWSVEPAPNSSGPFRILLTTGHEVPRVV